MARPWNTWLAAMTACRQAISDIPLSRVGSGHAELPWSPSKNAVQFYIPPFTPLTDYDTDGGKA